MEMKFEKNTFGARLSSMLKVDFRRMFTMRLVYIMLGICLVAPILILVMTTMMDGTVTVDPQTGVETTIEAFDSTWQAISSYSDAGMSMDMTGMCNLNLVYFGAAVLVCLFVTEDFRSGYAKNLFTVRAKKADYVISKTIVGIVGGMLMILAFFLGAMLGGVISGLPFDTGTAGVSGIVMCVISKLLLIAVFVPIYVLASVVAKSKTWMSLVGSLAVGMLLFMMIPALTPLDSTIMNVVLCLAGGVLFSAGLGAVSGAVLKKSSLV
ncbi:MAG: ABC transporter permease [Clostridia bacterium]|nr:ABC transporter permease [Clostridia bacterium]